MPFQNTRTAMGEAGRSSPPPLPPGSTIGILGSGQLGRMLALAAARLGLDCHIYADASGPAMAVAARHTIAAYDDHAALTGFAGAVGAVTYEFENVPVATVRLLETMVPVRPGARALQVAQDRLAEKTFLKDQGIAVAPFAAVENPAMLTAVLARWRTLAILKTRRLGYDGKGQVGLAPDSDAEAAMALIGNRPAVVEQRVEFAQEFSVLLVRAADGASDVYDIPRNSHGNGILARSVVPAGLDAATVDAAHGIGRRIAHGLDYVGVLAVEMFDLGQGVPLPGRLIVNEIAPRVHNSGHWTIDACAVSQFENHMRAVAGWPLGGCARHSDAVMDNLIGPEALDWRAIAAEPGAALHLYGKGDARPGRKMGHVTRLGPRTD